MKNLMDKHTMIKLKLEGHSIREIARMLKIDRKTVTKYWKEYNDLQKQLETEPENAKEVQEKMISTPKYDASNRKPVKYTENIDARLEEILEEENRKNLLLKQHKQKRTKLQIFNQLKSEGFDISYSTVTRKINAKVKCGSECFIKQEHEYGDRLEYDFGEVKLMINGELGTYHLAVLSSPAANFRWAYLYKNQKKGVFLDSHVRFFDMMGGVYKEVVYDNMRNVVSRFIGRREKELNDDLIKMSIYYGFGVNVTNCFSGNEKGHVEGSVKIIRNKVFAEKYEFLSFDDATTYLQSCLEEMNQTSTISEEKPHLLPVKPKLELATLSTHKVNKYSFIQLENNFYSVPEYLVQKEVNVKSYYNRIVVYSNNSFVCEHKRKDGSGEISIDIMHYLNSLSKKPGAIKNSTALKSIPKLKAIFDDYFSTNPKKFIELLLENQTKSIGDIIMELERYTQFSSGTLPIDCLSNSHGINLTTQAQTYKYEELVLRKAE